MLTDAQKAIIKADWLANKDSFPPNWWAEEIANLWYNVPADPPWIVWRTEVPIDDIMRNGMDWARVDNLSTGKARIWDWMGRLGTLNASKPNIRAGIDATWVGTAADLAVLQR